MKLIKQTDRQSKTVQYTPYRSVDQLYCSIDGNFGGFIDTPCSLHAVSVGGDQRRCPPLPA